MSSRDDFSKPTIEILGKRVGFLCSNPSCRRHTVGPNEDPLKSTIIGIAAHITAASRNGPRYDSSLTENQRKHIDNGLWLCGNCSILVDRNETHYSVQLLKAWKQEAENEMSENLLGRYKELKSKETPFLEADLIWTHGGRKNRGYSKNNPKEIIDGQEVFIVGFGFNSIVFWELHWSFSFTIHNNSRVPAYNVKVEQIGEVQFSTISNLNSVNNLPPFKSLDLEAEFFYHIEGDYEEADRLLDQKIPSLLEGHKLRITYQDDERNNHATLVKINNNEIVNSKE